MSALTTPALAALAAITVLSGRPITSRPATAPPSDQVGVYALIEALELLPNAGAPTSVSISGAFALAEGPHGDYYRAPRWGRLEFKIAEGSEDKCRAQWKDLQSMAGTGTCVGFGFRYEQHDLEVRQDGEAQGKGRGDGDGTGRQKRELPEFRTGMGVTKVRNADYGPIAQLRHLPKPMSPIGPDRIPAGDPKRPQKPLVLVARNCLASGDGVRYLFEVERPGGDVLGSPPLEPGPVETSWKVALALKPGEQVTWRVRTLADGIDPAPVATASFTVARPPK